jgi:hypothetical protein
MKPSDPCNDFDEWLVLAKEDPDAFEQRRSRLIDSFIQDAPDHLHHRLRGLQFRIDMERRRARTPMGACVRISGMMWDAFLGEGGLRDALTGLTHESIAHSVPKHSGKARIIKFRREDNE